MKVIRILFVGLLPLFCQYGFGQNLALHCPYTLSEKPNYDYSAPSSDKVSLTDGIYTDGRFWIQQTTVGWKYKDKVTIRLDLKKIAPVGQVIFSSGAGTAGVHYPKHLYVFLSLDGKHYSYAGDAAKNTNRNYGTYNTQKLELESINKKARWLTIVAIPKGNYLFFDEIEVLKGKFSNLNNFEKSFAAGNLELVADSLQKFELRHKKLLEQASSLTALQFNKNIQKASTASKSLSDIRATLGEERIAYLKDQYQSGFIVEKSNPWAPVQALQQVEDAQKQLGYSVSIPLKGVQYGAFLLTNSTSQKSEFTFDLSRSSNVSANIELFQMPFLWSTGGQQIADALIPVNEQVKLKPGLTKMFFFKLSGKSIGKGQATINISNGEKKFEISINFSVNNIFKSEAGFALDANNWGYLTYPMLKDRKQNAAKDLEAHHINTIVVPHSVIPNLQSDDFSKLVNYLNYFENIKKILLFPNYSWDRIRHSYKDGQFMSPEWKRYFKTWYTNLVDAIHNRAHPEAQVYFYPYDEVHNSKDIRDFKSLIEWAKENVAGIMFYATLNNEKAIEELLPLLDIAQLHYSQRERFLNKLPPSNAELWFYKIAASSRALPAYQYYRLMAWQAFAYNFTGIGFWNYADEREGDRINSIANPVSDLSESYSIIYTGPNKSIISTRRWEAFKLGIEDHQIIQQYVQKYGREKTLELVNKVLDNPNDYDMADSIRSKMITEL